VAAALRRSFTGLHDAKNATNKTKSNQTQTKLKLTLNVAAAQLY
jgi:hypothetical protein